MNVRLGALLSTLTGAVLLTGCPDDETTPSDTEGTGTGSDGGTMPSTTMPPTTMTATTMMPTTDPTPGTDDTGVPMTDDGITTDDGADSSSTGGESESSSTDTGTMATCVDEALSDTLPVVVTGTTVGGGDDFVLLCTNGNSQDYIYEFTAPADGSYTFDTIGSAIDTILAVFEGCDGKILGCDDDIGFGVFESEVVVELTQGQTVIVVVDGYNVSGAFTLNVSETPPPPEICAFAGVEMPACADTATGASSVNDTLSCDVTDALAYLDLYEIPVSAGDCLFVSADNIGAGGPTGATGADLFLLLLDPTTGDFASLDDEIPCSDPTFGGPFGCPQAGATATSDGTILLGIGQYGGAGCPEGAPYTLTVGINGVDVDPGTPITQDDPSDCG